MNQKRAAYNKHPISEFFLLSLIPGLIFLAASCVHISESASNSTHRKQNFPKTIEKAMLPLDVKQLTDTNPLREIFAPVEKALNNLDLVKTDALLGSLVEKQGDILIIKAWASCYFNRTHNNTQAEKLAADIINQIPEEQEQLYPELAYAKALALTSLGQSAFSRQYYEKAIGFLMKGISIFPGLLTPRAILGDIYVKMQNNQKAKKWYQSALDLAPEFGPALAGIIGILWQDKNSDKALLMLQTALAKNPAEPCLLQQRGMIFHEMGNFIDAESDFRNALKVKPWKAQLWAELGKSLDMQDNHEGAEKAYQKAIQLDPSSIDSRFNMAMFFYNHNRYQEAIKEIETLEKLATVNQPDIYLLKIELLTLLGRKHEIPDTEKKMKALQAADK